MHQALKLHPDSRCGAATCIEAEVSRGPTGNLLLHYFVTGKMSDLVIPLATAPPSRADELWRHTCFEAFVRASDSAAYYEFNFAPSMQWAAYRFGGYRSGMRLAGEIAAPSIELTHGTEQFELRAYLKLYGLAGLPSEAAWRLGLAAVIEETSGRKSYWALAHPPGKADFHHADCFAHELPAAVRP